MRHSYRWFSIAVIGVIVICGSTDPASALDRETPLSLFVWDRWSGDDLPSRSVRAVVYGRDGYIWSPSYGGLIRFDGRHFETFNPPEGFGITTNGFTAASPRSDAGLWLGGTGGGVYRFSQSEFVCVLQPGDSRINTIGTILDTGTGRVWVGGSTGLVRLDERESGWEPQWFELLAEREIAGLATGDDGAIWVATDGGLFRVPEGEPIEAHPNLAGSEVSALTVDDAGDFWVWVVGRGLLRMPGWDDAPLEFRSLNPMTDVSALYFDRDGALWLGGDDSLYRWAGGKLERWPDPADGGALSLTEDREGNLWFSSYYEGLVRLAEGKFTVFSVDEGVSNQIVHAVTEDNEGGIWVGSESGLSVIRDDRVEPLPEALEVLRDAVVLSVAVDEEGILWIGTYGGGLFSWDGLELEQFGPADGLDEVRLRRLKVEGDTLWIGSFNGLFALREGVFSRWSRADGLLNDFILAIERSSSGELLLATDGGGLHVLSEDSIRVLTTADGLPSMFVTDLHEDASGALWLATAAGISRFKDGIFGSATAADGLVGRAFLQVLEDDHGYLWMTSDEGISRVAKAEIDALMDGRAERVTVVHFDRADGLHAVKMTGTASAIKATDGRLWFSTMNGAAVVDPARIVFNKIPPPVYVESVMADGRRLRVEDGQLVVPGGFRTLEIRYSGLSFVSPDKVRFRYRLTGYADDWEQTGSRRTAYFTRLKPQDYRFEVIACNNDGLWNSDPAIVSFTVEPLFYQTKIFFVGCAAAVFLLGLSVMMIRVRSLKRRERALAELVDARTWELAEANEELAELATIDGLTEIANFRRFKEFLDEAWRRCVREEHPLSVVMIDIDLFKRFNDRYGHQEGDDALRQVAAMVREATRRPGDLAARYGGEEFVLVLTNTNREGAYRLAEIIREDVLAAGIPHEESDLGRVSISAGVATVIPDSLLEPDELVSRADTALYRAKQTGRNRVEQDEDGASCPE